MHHQPTGAAAKSGFAHLVQWPRSMLSSTIYTILLFSFIGSLAAPSSTQLASFAVMTNSSRTSSTQTLPHSRHLFATPTRPTFPPGGPEPSHFLPHHNSTVLPKPSATDGWRHHRTETTQHLDIFFEVAGGLAGLTILLSCIRCCYVYRKTPARDRIAAVLHRHQLDQELAEIRCNGFPHLSRSPTRDPVPPYFPPPPAYEIVAPIRSLDTSSGRAQHSGYFEVATSSPPHSPRSTLRVEIIESPSRTHTPTILNG